MQVTVGGTLLWVGGWRRVGVYEALFWVGGGWGLVWVSRGGYTV